MTSSQQPKQKKRLTLLPGIFLICLTMLYLFYQKSLSLNIQVLLIIFPALLFAVLSFVYEVKFRSIVGLFVLSALFYRLIFPDRIPILKQISFYTIVLVEIGSILYIIYKFFPKYMVYKRNNGTLSEFIASEFKQAENDIRRNPIISSVLSELKAMRYVFKRKFKPGEFGENVFFSKDIDNAKGIYLALVVLSIFEIPVLHLILYNWNPRIAIVITIISTYSFLYVLGLMNSLGARPIYMSSSHIYIRVGLDFSLTTPISNIRRIHRYESGANNSELEFTKTTKGCKPTIIIEFFEAVTAVKSFGILAECKALGLSTNNDDTFLKYIQDKMVTRDENQVSI